MNTAVLMTRIFNWEGTMPFVVYSTYLMPKQTPQPLYKLQLFMYSMCVVLP